MNNKGFTLIELLIVIAIIGILAAAVLVAVDPVGRIQEARDARRWSESNALLNAVLNKQVDARALYEGFGVATVAASDTVGQVIFSNATGSANPTFTTCAALGGNVAQYGVNMYDLAPQYIAQIPMDPNGGTAADTGYYFRRNLAGRITIGACNPEKTPTGISVTR